MKHSHSVGDGFVTVFSYVFPDVREIQIEM